MAHTFRKDYVDADSTVTKHFWTILESIMFCHICIDKDVNSATAQWCSGYNQGLIRIEHALFTFDCEGTSKWICETNSIERASIVP